MYNPVKISDALGIIATVLLDVYGEFYDLEVETQDPTQLMMMKKETTRFTRKIQFITQSFAAALQGGAAFKHAMEQDKLMYSAHTFGNSDIITAFLPRSNSRAPWFEIVMTAKMTPLQMFDGSKIYLNLNR
jgi:hypothetical protein